MSISQIPAVAIGTLSGNLPKNVTTAAGPLPGANGAPSGPTVSLNQSNDVQGVSFTPFKQMQITGNVSLTPAQLLQFQSLFEMQTGDLSSSQADGSTTPTS